MAAAWSEYQEEAAELFRTLGLEASTNVTLRGVRTEHDVDVLVKSVHSGFEVVWIVECKLWNSRVSKLHVLALREIVSDTGVDRGIMMAEKGFQSGASGAAALTNVHLTSLASLRGTTSGEVFGMRLSELHDRVEVARDRYWAIPKYDRIEHGLRPDGMGSGFSGTSVISLAEDVLRKGFRGTFPFETDFMHRQTTQGFPEIIETVEQLLEHLEPLIRELEDRLDACVASLNAGTSYST